MFARPRAAVGRSLACLRGRDARVESREGEKSECEIADHGDDRFGVMLEKAVSCLGRSAPLYVVQSCALGAFTSTIVMAKIVATNVAVWCRRIPYAGI